MSWYVGFWMLVVVSYIGFFMYKAWKIFHEASRAQIVHHNYYPVVTLHSGVRMAYVPRLGWTYENGMEVHGWNERIAERAWQNWYADDTAKTRAEKVANAFPPRGPQSI